MFNKIQVNLNRIFLFCLNINIILGFYNRSKYATCGNFTKGCSIEITYNYPISPKIPTSLPLKAMLNPYWYIYLLFYIPKSQAQKSFYLEAYDINTRKTIITDGDCHFINTNENTNYEIRIDRQLNDNSFIQFKFLGLQDNFKMRVDIEFFLNLPLFWTDIALSKENSLYKLQQESLKEYIKSLNKKYILLKERQIKTKKLIENIMKKMFDTTIDINFYEDDLMYSETVFVPPCATVTITAALGIEISTESIFEKQDIELSKTKVVNGKIEFHSGGINLFGDETNLNNNILSILDLYNKRIEDIILNFGFESDSFSVSIGTNALYNCLVITIRYFDDVNLETIYSEIEIKIEIDNKKLNEIVINKARNSIVVIDNKKIITGVVYSLIIFSMILATNGAAAPAVLSIPLF